MLWGSYSITGPVSRCFCGLFQQAFCELVSRAKNGERRMGKDLGRAAKERCSYAFLRGTRRQLCSTKMTPEYLCIRIQIRLNRFSLSVLFKISKYSFDLPVFPNPVADEPRTHYAGGILKLSS